MADTSQSDPRRSRPADGGSGRPSPIIVIMLGGILLGVIVIPVVQGRSDGIDAYTAICRALGILPGSPAAPSSLRKHASDTGIAGDMDTGSAANSRQREAGRGRAKVQEVCVACHGEKGVSAAPENSASRRAIGRGDLQAAQRLSDRKPSPSADDGRRQGAG